MSVFLTSDQAVKQGSRRVLIMGSPGTGKTTLSISASKHAGETIGASPADCSDVVLFQGDSDGLQGALDAGLKPGLVVDFTVCDDWAAYSKLMVAAVQELKPMVDKGDIKYLVVDLSLPAKLIIDKIKPMDVAAWGKVASEGMVFYKSFGFLKGATIIGNAQIKSAQAAVENAVAAAAADAKASGGERATFTADLPKSIMSPWAENASLILSREVKKKRNPMKPNEPPTREFFTHTSASSRFETKSRFATKLLPTEPGERTLHSLLKAAYGDLL